MRKKIVLGLVGACALFFVTGCNSDPATRLMDLYVRVYSNADMNALKEMYAPFYIEASKDYIKQEYLDSQRDRIKDQYGDDFKITYKIIEKTEFTSEELDKINKEFEDYYNAKDKAEQCFKLKAEMTVKGSKKEETDTNDSLSYCKINGKWYFAD